MRCLLLGLAVLASLASARADKDTAKVMQDGKPGVRAAKYCTDAGDMPEFVICEETYYDCVNKKRREEQYGRKMGECRQR